MLAFLSGETWFASARKVVDLIDALAAIQTGSVVRCLDVAIVNVDVAEFSGPSGLTNTLVAEQLVDAVAVHAVRRETQVDLVLAAFSGKAVGTFAPKVIDQVGAIGSQQTGLFGAVVDVLVAERAIPSGRTLAEEPALFVAFAFGVVAARVVGARVDRDVAVVAGVA